MKFSFSKKNVAELRDEDEITVTMTCKEALEIVAVLREEKPFTKQLLDAVEAHASVVPR